MVILGLGTLAVRLLTLQVVYGERYRVLSDENRVKTIRISAPRGVIYDRNGVVLASNQKFTKIEDDEVREKYLRVYPFKENTAHVMGYLGEVKEDEVGLLKESGSKYSVGDLVGRTGIEYTYENQLRGIEGGRLVEVDNRGQVSRELGRKEPQPGTDIHLAVDAVLQEIASSAMAGKKGAVIVSIPNTGEIMALVSSPTYDPNLFVGDINDLKTSEIQKVLTDENLPMFNRAIGGVYPPGSTFKMVTTTAAIDSGKVSPGFVYEDSGVIRVGIYSYNNWLFSKSGGTEGVIGFARALTRSTDTFFYKVGEMTGPATIAEWGKKMALSEKTDIDLPGEVEGLMPNPDWKKEVKGEAWFLGDTYIMSIGQGDILTTPIQINRMTNILASQGKKCRLHLVSEDMVEHGCEEVEIAPETLDIIRKGMTGACSSGGTAFPLFDWNDAALKNSGGGTFSKAGGGQTLPIVACKTGTAEYMSENGKMRTHGWLTAFAPVEQPKISVTVLMEGGGEGSNVAAPVVRKILAKFFEVTDLYPYGAIKNEISE
jgi:penicillin-binding protein 2